VNRVVYCPTTDSIFSGQCCVDLCLHVFGFISLCFECSVLTNYSFSVSVFPIQNQKILYTCIAASRDKTVKIWQPGKDTAIGTLEGHELTVQGMDVKRDGSMVCSGSRDGRVCFWDVSTMALLGSGHIDRNLVTDLRFFSDDRRVLQCSEDLVTKVWDVSSHSVAHSLPKAAHHFPLACAVDPSGGPYFALGYNGFQGTGCFVQVWDERSLNEPVHILTGHEEAVRSVCFLSSSTPSASTSSAPSSSSLRLASTSKDKTLRVWEVDVGDPICTATTSFQESGTLSCVSADENRLFVSCESGSVVVLDSSSPVLTTMFHSSPFEEEE